MRTMIFCSSKLYLLALRAIRARSITRSIMLPVSASLWGLMIESDAAAFGEASHQ
jgi:hypothetical protein